MDIQLLLEYTWVFFILIGLEGLLAADNALIIAIMVRHLPEKERRKALFYGLAGAFILRFGSLFIISFLVDVWFLQAIGAAYLLFIAINYFYRSWRQANGRSKQRGQQGSGFWMTVLKVEIADLAFAVDSILAAVALAMALPPLGTFTVGGLDGGQFIVIFTGGMIGVIIMRFAANVFVTLLKQRPSLEAAAFLIVGWVGVKLLVITLAHEDVAILPNNFVQSTLWKLIFYGGLLLIIVIGWIVSSRQKLKQSP